jgi:ATP-dependent DNA helicase RecG
MLMKHPTRAGGESDSGTARRYRNHRLGNFLKELDLTEGRSTGVPTIQEKLADNGSPRATFETTEDRVTFLIYIPSRLGSGYKSIAVEDGELGNGMEKAVETTTERATETTTERIIRLIKENPQITNKELADACGITEDGVYWNTKKLKKKNIIRRVGPDFGGHWEIIDKQYA